MNKESQFFISVLSDHLSQRITPPTYGVDWSIIAKISQYHQVSGIVYFQCKKFMPDDIKPFFLNSYQCTVFLHVHYRTAARQIKNEFDNNNIEMFTVKGLETAQYYPYPELRTMGDIDLIVHKNDRENADNVLRKMKYQNESNRDDKEWIYQNNLLVIELHNRLVYNETINKYEIEALLYDCWSYVKEGKLDDSFHFLFLLAHLRKHLMNTGVGFRQFMDLAVMAKNNTSLNWKWIKEKLIELHLYKFAQVSFGLIKRWFGLSTDITPEALDDDFYALATESIMANGVFGFQNNANQTNATVNAIRKYSNSKIGILTTALKFFFPSYQDMSSRSAYSYLERWPVLLPVSWGHRFIRGVLKKDDLKKQTKQLFVNKQEITNRETYLNNWGL